MKQTKKDFVHVGNNLAMDFINTQIICNEQDIDLLTCMNDLHQWASEIDVELDCASNETTTNKDIIEKNCIEKVHCFRKSLKTLITMHQSALILANQSVPEKTVNNEDKNKNKSEDETQALSTLNHYLCHAPSQKRLTMVGPKYSLETLNQKLSVNQLLGKIALAAANLLTSSHGQHIKNCANEKCILMFVDISRSKKRRWCSMDRCGNRSKASKFYHANKEV